MAIAFVQVASSNTVTGGGQTSLLCSVPTGTSNGHVMVAAISWMNDPGTITLTGWTAIRNDVEAAAAERCFLYYRVASSEPSDYTVTWTNNRHAVFSIVTYSGVDTSTPVDVSGGQTQTGTTTVTAPAVTPSSGTKMLLGFFSMRDARTFTNAVMTERNDRSSGSGSTHTSQEVAEQSITGGSSTGTRTASASGTSSNSSNVGQLVALNQSGGASLQRSFAVIVA